MLSGYPNYWPRDMSDRNLRALAWNGNLRGSDFDTLSIMKYFFGSWMFNSGTTSQCYSSRNYTLSQQDKRGAVREYPLIDVTMTEQQSLRSASLREAIDSLSLSAANKTHPLTICAPC